MPKNKIPLEQQQKYVLLADTGSTNYMATRGWEPGTVLRRVSDWMGSNGAGRHLKQAYFVRDGDSPSWGRIAWSDHVELIEPQVQVKVLPPDPAEEFEQLELFEIESV